MTRRYAILLAEGPARTAALADAGTTHTVIEIDPAVTAEPGRCLAVLERSGATDLVVPDALLHRLLAHPAAALSDLADVRRLVVHGTAVPDAARAVFPEAQVHLVPTGRSAVSDPEIIAAAAAAVGSRHDPAAVRAVVAQLDHAVLASMLHALQQDGVITGRDGSTTEDVLTGCGVLPAHHGLVRRWLDVLAAAGLLDRTGDRWRADRVVDAAAVHTAWDAVEDGWAAADLGGPAFPRYLRANAERADELMTGRVSAVSLLFNEGRDDLAAAVYRDTATARTLGAAVAAAAAAIGPRRVVEIGAGTGATTDAVLAALPAGVDYLFTDVSGYFLDRARARYGEHGGVRTALLDAADPAAAARHAPVDLVVAAGALNAVPDADSCVAGLVRALAPGGWLLVTEPTREHLEILVSQAFMMTPPRDARAASGATFLTADQWRAVFTGAGLHPVAVLPPDDDPLASLGQRLFLVRAPHP